jgi:hypothetical protein
MFNWPDDSLGLPPTWYSTHTIAPMIAISGSRIKRLVCFGSGSITMVELISLPKFQQSRPAEIQPFTDGKEYDLLNPQSTTENQWKCRCADDQMEASTQCT